MATIIQEKMPDLFLDTGTDGTCFKCSESYVRKFPRETMGWSERCATKVAQKLPENHEDILKESFFARHILTIHNHRQPCKSTLTRPSLSTSKGPRCPGMRVVSNQLVRKTSTYPRSTGIDPHEWSFLCKRCLWAKLVWREYRVGKQWWNKT